MQIEVSNGEIIDKITILEIKLQRIKNLDKILQVQKEYDLLVQNLTILKIDQEHPLYQKLKMINIKLWEIEDKLRIKEQKQEFDQDFINLARSVYFTNDERAEIKKEINHLSGSLLFEEKEYVEYQKNK